MPCDLINRMLVNHNIKLQIIPPDEEDTYYEVHFKNEFTDKIKFSELSSGEKVIIHLFTIWLNSQLGQKDWGSLVLIDEFDAHLNPSLAQIYLNVIKDVLVNNMNCQVFLTTHSPSSVAFTPEENLFWIENGKVLWEDKTRKSKIDILNALSAGIHFALNDEKNVLHFTHDILKPYIIFCEGSTDVDTIIKLCYKLSPDKYKIINNKCNIIAFNGTENFCSSLFKNLSETKKIIVLFDYDKSGNDEFKNFTKQFNGVKNEYIKMLNDNYIATIIQPSEKTEYKYQKQYGYFPIEACYPIKILEQHFNNSNIEFNPTIEVLDNKYVYSKKMGQDVKDNTFLSSYWSIKSKEAKSAKQAIIKDIDNMSEEELQGFMPTMNNLLAIVKYFESQNKDKLLG